MNTKMYVGNLPFKASAQEITDLFSQYGGVTDVFLPIDRESGHPRGFAFVSMDTPEAMQAAIAGLNGKDFGGRLLAINEARPREERPGGFGGGGGRGAVFFLRGREEILFCVCFTCTDRSNQEHPTTLDKETKHTTDGTLSMTPVRRRVAMYNNQMSALR